MSHVSSIDHAYDILHRMQLIAALNVEPAHSPTSYASHLGIPTRQTTSMSTSSSKLPQTPLRKQDYPNVKHWERRHNDATQISALKVRDADSSDYDSDSMDNVAGGVAKQEGVFAFLEDENGNVINRHKKKQLYAELRAFWNDNIDPNYPSDNWSSAGATLRDKFRDVLEEKYPFLRLCAGRWKVEALWKRNYHSWKRSLLARQARRTPLKTGCSEDGSKRKRKGSLELVDSSGETEILHDGPQAKKTKTSMQHKNATLSSKVFFELFLRCLAYFIIDEGPFVRFTDDSYKSI